MSHYRNLRNRPVECTQTENDKVLPCAHRQDLSTTHVQEQERLEKENEKEGKGESQLDDRVEIIIDRNNSENCTLGENSMKEISHPTTNEQQTQDILVTVLATLQQLQDSQRENIKSIQTETARIIQTEINKLMEKFQTENAKLSKELKEELLSQSQIENDKLCKSIQNIREETSRELESMQGDMKHLSEKVNSRIDRHRAETRKANQSLTAHVEEQTQTLISHTLENRNQTKT
jgi:hypothetical protein